MARRAPAPGWWREAVIHQLYVRSFADGNGDGIGDLTGARARLPYLRDLGVDAVWLNPWYASPMADGGYDVADYRAIEPSFGTLADAEAFIREALDLGIRTIVDIVPNHVSDQPRAGSSRRSPPGPGSPLRDRFWFRPGRGADGALPPNGWLSHFGDRAWTRTTDPDGTPGDWYLHLFAPAQPDLNWDHPDVRREHEDVLRFWFDRGAAGVRIDSAALAVKDPALPEVDPDHGARRATRSSTATSCTTSTAAGARSPTPTTRRACSSARCGWRTTSASPATCDPTSCTPRSTSTSSPARGTPTALRALDRPPRSRRTRRSGRRRRGSSRTTTSPGW